MNRIKIIGGGLAGCEAAYQLLKRGYGVDLYEMRPTVSTPIHKTGDLAELVCSNSLKSTDENTAQGLLKYELEAMDSIILKVAKTCSVPAGGALAVERKKFSQEVEKALKKFDKLNIIGQECLDITPYTIVASGPLTSDSLAQKIAELLGEKELKFFDAVAPIVTYDSIDMSKAFFAGRYNKGGEDYINCPLDEKEYYDFVDNLITSDKIILKEFEKKEIFNACMPIEVMAAKGKDSLRFGPLRPVGIYDPITSKRPFAVVQLRKEDNTNECYNIVGFQTNLTFGEQKRVFGIIPALKNAEYTRYGVMHRNTFINSPKVLNVDFSLKKEQTIFFGGQISGVEGYLESTMSGLVAAINMARKVEQKAVFIPPKNTMSGSLMRYIAAENADFQPMHVSFMLVSELEEKVKDKQKRKQAYSNRAKKEIDYYMQSFSDTER